MTSPGGGSGTGSSSMTGTGRRAVGSSGSGRAFDGSPMTASASGEISWWSAIGASALGPRLWQPASHPPTSTTATHVRVRGCRGLEGWSLLSCVDPPASLECIDGDPTDRFAVGKRYRSQREKFPEIRGPTDVVERRHLETKGDPPRDRSPLL